ncbi:MAG: Gfo/Idh/MocA family oxidoreductase [Clostridia bacterium]|nr:Gfo/Idh/MocA family oxidoreductase [Clostridia bacterium]
MKKIGFVDYYISEWHANNYPAWLEKACAQLGLDYTVAYCWAEVECSPVDGKTTDQWCNDFGVEKCATLEELCEKSDVIVILSPTNPETHYKYAKCVLPYGKPTYIDKTFAPDHATAEKIFALAEEYGTPFFSTSALRYAEELNAADAPRHMMAMGGGSNLPEYFIHLGEMVVKKMGIGVQHVSAVQNGPQWVMKADYADGRSAVMVYAAALPYGLYFAGEEGEVWKNVASPFFDGLIADMLRFFETGKPSFDPAETLEVMKLRDMALAAVEACS